MIVKGYSKVFSTKNEEQYENIGAFWDMMAAIYGRDSLQGLGFNWQDDSIEYLIGLKEDDIPRDAVPSEAVYKEVSLPDDGWHIYRGKTEKLAEIYGEIYEEGTLSCEIEMFDDSGNCCLWINRSEF